MKKVFPVHRSSIHALDPPSWVLSLCFCIPGGMSPGEGGGDGRLLGTDSLARTFANPSSRVRKSTHMRRLPRRQPMRVASSAFADTGYEQAAEPDVLGTRFPKHADGPHSPRLVESRQIVLLFPHFLALQATSRSATNRSFFSPHFLALQAYFFDGVRTSGSCQKLIDVPTYHYQAKVCTATRE